MDVRYPIQQVGVEGQLNTVSVRALPAMLVPYLFSDEKEHARKESLASAI